jgi:uncharacterized lipoprotein YajG
MRLVAVVLASFFVLTSCASSDQEPTTTTETTEQATNAVSVVEISVTVGEDSGADRTASAALGTTVRITLVNDEIDDEFHLHGYDIASSDIAAGDEAVMEFVADTGGEFELESHVTGEVLLVLVIQ